MQRFIFAHQCSPSANRFLVDRFTCRINAEPRCWTMGSLGVEMEFVWQIIKCSFHSSVNFMNPVAWRTLFVLGLGSRGRKRGRKKKKETRIQLIVKVNRPCSGSIVRFALTLSLCSCNVVYLYFVYFNFQKNTLQDIIYSRFPSAIPHSSCWSISLLFFFTKILSTNTQKLYGPKWIFGCKHFVHVWLLNF